MTKFLSVSEAADRLGVSEDSVRRHAKLVRFGRRTLVPAAWLEHLDDEPMPVPPEHPRKGTSPTRRTFDF